MTILKRPPGDAFSFRLFYQLINKIKTPKNYFYVWSAALSPEYCSIYPKDGELFYETETYHSSAIANSIDTDLIILGVKDHLSVGDFHPWTQNQPTTVEYLDNMFKWYPDKHFILLTSVENLEFYLTNKNVDIVPWGGDIVNHQQEYKKLQPVLEKNFNSTTTFISLNRNFRSQRLMLLSLLHGLEIEKHGLLSCMFKKSIDTVQELPWEFSQEQQPQYNIFLKGLGALKSSDMPLNDNIEIYVNGNNDNVSNFKNKLANYYQNTFVEIISETSFTERCYLLTEKTLNSVFGCNFPILLCGCGSVALLREMGLDVFDDVINHRYDLLENPIDRLYYAIQDNITILTDNDLAKELWKKNQARFAKNVEFVKTEMYKFYTNRATEKFQQIIDSNKY
jgi:hypothetical protein